MSPTELSVVIPVFNERDNIGALLDEIAVALEHGPAHEIIVVDDGSSDDTCAVLRDRRGVMPGLRVLRHASRCGQSAALRSGILAARGAWIATLDGDGQNVPADILLLWSRRPGGNAAHCRCAVLGRRAGRRDNLVRKFSSRVANAVRSRLLSDDTVDTGCGLKLFPRALFLELPWFDHMHRFLPALILRAGGHLVPVDVGHRPRLGGRSKYGVHNRLWAGIVDLLGVMWLQRRYKQPVVEEEK